MDRKPAMIREPLEFICIYISYYILERERERESKKNARMDNFRRKKERKLNSQRPSSVISDWRRSLSETF